MNTQMWTKNKWWQRPQKQRLLEAGEKTNAGVVGKEIHAKKEQVSFGIDALNKDVPLHTKLLE